MMKQWQIRGTAQLTGLVPQNALVNATFQFQSYDATNKVWNDINVSSKQKAYALNGTANLDTGWLNFSPVKGQQFRVVVAASYINGNGKKVLFEISSDPITPID